MNEHDRSPTQFTSIKHTWLSTNRQPSSERDGTVWSRAGAASIEDWLEPETESST